jgi:hypothetical protein
VPSISLSGETTTHGGDGICLTLFRLSPSRDVKTGRLSH